MSLGLATLTIVHVLLSLVGIGSGVVEMFGLLTGKRFRRWTAVFLTTTVATSATGFLFPADRFLPSHAFGILSLIVLTIALLARGRFHTANGWRVVYGVSAVVAFYLNFFVLIVQSFLKVPALKALAPTQTEPAFMIAQFIALLLFVGIGIAVVIKLRAESTLLLGKTAELPTPRNRLTNPTTNGVVV